MRRLSAGVVGVSLVIGCIGSAAAGYFYSSQDLWTQRGSRCGDSLFTGYVAGAYDVMAALYPATSGTLGALEDEVRELILAHPEFLKDPAAFVVISAMLRKGDISKKDVLRLFPEPWRERLQTETE